MSVSREKKSQKREREKRERKGLESNFPIATEEDDKKIRMSVHIKTHSRTRTSRSSE